MSNDMLHKEEQKESFHVMEQAELREHILTQTTWNLQEGENLEEKKKNYLEQAYQGQLQDMEKLRKTLSGGAEAPQVKKTAAGTPRQEVQPQKLSWKEQQNRKKQLREAKKHHPQADRDSAALASDMQSYRKNLENSIKSKAAKNAAQTCDPRVLRIFSRGYRTNAVGRPLNKEEAWAKQQDETFYEEYGSGDLKRREPYLRRWVTELVSFNVTKEMMEMPGFLNHARILKQKIDRATYLENVMKDKINQPFFEKMAPYRREILEQNISALTLIGGPLTNLLREKGVTDKGEYLPATTKLEPFRAMAPQFSEKTREILEQRDQAMEKAADKAFKEGMETERQPWLTSSDDVLADQEYMEEMHCQGVKFTGYVVGYPIPTVSDCIKLIEEHPEAYAKNQALMDQILQETYRLADSIGNWRLDADAAQSLSRENEGAGIDKALVRKACGTAIHEANAKMRNVFLRLSALKELEDHYLKGKPLTERAKLQEERLTGGGSAEA